MFHILLIHINLHLVLIKVYLLLLVWDCYLTSIKCLKIAKSTIILLSFFCPSPCSLNGFFLVFYSLLQTLCWDLTSGALHLNNLKWKDSFSLALHWVIQLSSVISLFKKNGRVIQLYQFWGEKVLGLMGGGRTGSPKGLVQTYL